MPVDIAYETLALATDTDMNQGRGQLNAALKAIKDQCIARDDDLATEIDARARIYKQIMGDALLTAPALAKHWLRCRPSAAPASQQTNRSTVVECSTCGGDRFVTYSMRRPEQTVWMKERGLEPNLDRLIEESAPCPDCNPAEYPRAPDPAQVRERLAR